MHVLVIFAHPSKASFTAKVLAEFLRGLSSTGHTYEIRNLYEDNFDCVLDGEHYTREMAWTPSSDVPEDVKREQEKVQNADALAFIYPVWWSDCPAQLKGWFDRVWTNGFAYFYNDTTRKSFIKPKKALVLCTAGHTVEHLEETGIAESMRCSMINDRLRNVGFTKTKMVILGGMTEKSEKTTRSNLKEAFKCGKLVDDF